MTKDEVKKLQDEQSGITTVLNNATKFYNLIDDVSLCYSGDTN